MAFLVPVRIAVACTIISMTAGLAQTPTPPPPLKELKAGFDFCGTVDGDTSVLKWGSAPFQFVRFGRNVPGTDYIVIGYNVQTKPPTLILEHKTTHERFQLTQR